MCIGYTQQKNVSLQDFFSDLGELEGKLKRLHDASEFLVTVCDDAMATKVQQRVHEIDERWRRVQGVMTGQSVHQYNAGLRDIRQWCDNVETELSRQIRADYRDLSAQNNWLEVGSVSLFCLLLYLL